MPQRRLLLPLISFSLLLPLSFTGMKCRDDGITPPPDNGPDTTSHNFTWTVMTLGDGNGSTLYDVAIINDTLAYAVGEIYLKDSTGNIDPTLFNLATWNGSKWTITRVYYPYQGQQFIAPLHSVFAFAPNDIWIASNQPMHWNGANWVTFDLGSNVWNGWINKMWGSSNSDLYLVGTGGSVAHYDGGTWTKIESGTTISLLDVWGGQKETGESEVIAIGSNGLFMPQGLALIQLRANQAVPLATTGLSLDMFGIWFVPGESYFSVGDGVYQAGIGAGNWIRQSGLPPYESYCVRGIKANDVFVVGAKGLLMHYNGSSWHVYTEHETTKFEGALGSIVVKDHLCFAVGFLTSGKAVCAIGRRQ